jgi:hypothetical protein
LICYWSLKCRSTRKISMGRHRSTTSPGRIDCRCCIRSSRMVRLLANEVDVNHTDKITSQTALFYSAREGHLEMCKLLI